MKDQILIRDAKISDQAFIFSSFLKGNYYGNDFYRSIDKNTFMVKYKEVLTHLLIKSTTKIACMKNDEDQVVGYSLYQPGILHYVFIKPTFRRFGISKMLIPVDVIYCTHLTKIGKTLKPPSWKFDPFRI